MKRKENLNKCNNENGLRSIMIKYGKMIQWRLLLLMLFFNNTVFCQDYPIDLSLAKKYFNEAKTLSDKDNGKLWGVKLYGPILIVDPDSRFIVANEMDNEGKLEKEDELYIGYLSETDMIANTATQWGGKYWMMVMINALSENKLARTNLIMHELYHRIQDEGYRLYAGEHAGYQFRT